MKEYEISNLYVIKLGEFIFFCEKHLDNTYKDIFTDEIFNRESINFVRPMEDLYELEVMKKLLAGEKLILTKRELLIKFAKVNSYYFERIASHNHVYDMLKEKLRMNHTIRLQHGECSAEVGFVWIDLLTNLERVSDHCSNIAGCIIEASHNEMNLHEGLRKLKFNNDVFETKYNMYLRKYAIK